MPTRLNEYVVSDDNYLSDENIINFVLFADCDPVRLDETIKDDHWNQAMDEKMHANKKNKMCELTSLTHRKKPIDIKRDYTTKYNPTEEVDHSRTRLVVKDTMKR